MLHLLKRPMEGTPLAALYRAVREEWRWTRQRFAKSRWGYKFAGRPDMQAGTFEPYEVAIIQHRLAGADVFVDIGAHIGYFTCLARSMGKHTVAVEPLPDNLRYLFANLEANGWTDGIEIYPIGLAERPGLASLYGGGTGASLVSGWAGISPHFRRTIALSTLDILLGDRFAGKSMVIKMDVEGMEYAALQGASKILKMDPRPTWLMEITLSEHRPGGRNPDFLNTFELFWNLGYQARSIGPRSREISRAEVLEYARTGDRPDWATGNYIFSVEG